MRWMTGASWVAFAILLLILGRQFLFACSFRLGVHAWSDCPVQKELGPFQKEQVERALRLQHRIHLAELRLAHKPPCDAPPQSNDIHNVEVRGGEHGRLEVILGWDTLDDLDLVITCPGGGKMGGTHGLDDSACGDGRIDVDANRNLQVNITQNPVEHAVWQKILSGRYEFTVMLYKAKIGTRGRNIPFRMTIILDGRQQACMGEISIQPRAAEQKSGPAIPVSRSATVDWAEGDPLPACKWRWESHY